MNTIEALKQKVELFIASYEGMSEELKRLKKQSQEQRDEISDLKEELHNKDEALLKMVKRLEELPLEKSDEQ